MNLFEKEREEIKKIEENAPISETERLDQTLKLLKINNKALQIFSVVVGEGFESINKKLKDLENRILLLEQRL